MRKQIIRKAVLFSAVICLAAIQIFLIAGSSIADNTGEQIKPVNPVEVCMVNDAVMGKPQIPVEYEGRTYYGCCEGCVGKLKANRAFRVAKDPLTGREVDKAAAFIAQTHKGEAMYFESKENAQKYFAGMKKQK